MPLPPKTAIALRYSPEQGDHAPKIVALGHGESASAILRVASEHDIPLRQDTALAGALSGLEIGASVPPELFRAVAEVLAWVYALEDKRPAKRSHPPVRACATGRSAR